MKTIAYILWGTYWFFRLVTASLLLCEKETLLDGLRLSDEAFENYWDGR
jgi:hypothetical protein